MGSREEKSLWSPGFNAVVEELAQGLDSVKKLASLLQLDSSENHPPGMSMAALLVEEIKGTISKAMAELKTGNMMVANQVDSPSCITSNKQFTAGKRKMQSTKTAGYRRRGGPYSCIKISSTTIDDGHPWRKYGQKDIYNATYPRSYFRCSHKFDQGCKASKQVQRSEEDPSMFVITYFGEHICTDATKAMPSLREPYIASFEQKNGGHKKQETLSSLSDLKQESEEEALSTISSANSPSDYFISAEVKLNEYEEQIEAGNEVEYNELSSGLDSYFNYGMDFVDFEDLFSSDHTTL